MAKRKRKRVYTIMKFTDSCNQKIKDGKPDVFIEYATHFWDAECLADYFFMEYYSDVPYDAVHDEYYRQNTCLTVFHHERKIRSNKNGIYISSSTIDDIYIVSKRDKVTNEFIEVYRTRDMDELANLFQLFNDYQNIGWYQYYDESFIDSFDMLWETAD